MAEAFSIIHGGDFVDAFSAGSRPSGKINPMAIGAMAVLEYDLKKHKSKSLIEVEVFAPFDIVVTMGCGDACPWMPAKKFIDWKIPDPKEMGEKDFETVRNMIETKVKDLLKSL